jgi:hypothetical protein
VVGKALGLQPFGQHLLTLEHHLGAVAEQQLQERPRHGQQAGPT